MRTFLTATLSIIATGVTLIAYALLSPRIGASNDLVTFDPRTGVVRDARGFYASERIALPGYSPAYAYDTLREPVAQPAAVRTVYTVDPTPAPRRTVTRVERAPRTNWKKTALVIGGAAATGAGVGALVGGKKGALIGAAIGGGGGTLWEVTRR
jgi:hypothetical protein